MSTWIYVFKTCECITLLSAHRHSDDDAINDTCPAATHDPCAAARTGHTRPEPPGHASPAAAAASPDHPTVPAYSQGSLLLRSKPTGHASIYPRQLQGSNQHAHTQGSSRSRSRGTPRPEASPMGPGDTNTPGGGETPLFDERWFCVMDIYSSDFSIVCDVSEWYFTRCWNVQGTGVQRGRHSFSYLYIYRSMYA